MDQNVVCARELQMRFTSPETVGYSSLYQGNGLHLLSDCNEPYLRLICGGQSHETYFQKSALLQPDGIHLAGKEIIFRQKPSNLVRRALKELLGEEVVKPAHSKASVPNKIANRQQKSDISKTKPFKPHHLPSLPGLQIVFCFSSVPPT